jgi:hypothetical protein
MVKNTNTGLGQRMPVLKTPPDTVFGFYTFGTDIFQTDIYLRKNGHLFCELHNAVGGKDIEASIKENLDAGVIWETLRNEDDSSIELQIPLLPTVNIWERVMLNPIRLGKFSSAANAAEIYWNHMGEQSILNADLGYLNPGEGVLIVRSMILDWFFSQRFLISICKASTHGYKEQVVLDSEMKANNERTNMQMLCLKKTGQCFSCCQQKAHLDINMADLIPDNDTKGRR